MLEPPPRIGPYKLNRRLGAGGMGEVFVAVDENLGRQVAIKRVRPGVEASASSRQRFLREARLAARLNHPSIVQIYALLEDGDDLYIVMEYVSGLTLRQRLDRDGAIETQELTRIARALAEGLREAHREGIIHRDLKTENVLLGDSGSIKIADFGIARPIQDDEGMEALTATQAVVGTYRTMSPEQARGERLDERSDLFSLGVLLYEAATGKTPFPGENSLATLNRIITHRQTPANEIRPDLPFELSQLIDHLLEKHPALRPQSADELLTLLGQAEASTTQPEDTSTVVAPSADSLSRTTTLTGDPIRPTSIPTPRRRWLWGSVMVTAILVLAFGYLLLREPSRPLFVVVPTPQIDDQSPSPVSALLVPAVRFGLTSGLLSLDGISVLATDEVEEGNSPPTRLSTATGADEILSADLVCRPQNCQVTLRRVHGRDGTVVASQLFDVPTDDLQVLTTAVISFVRAAYAGFSSWNNVPLDVRRVDYEEFLRLQRSFKEKDKNLSDDQILARLGAIQRTSPRFTGALHLAADILRYRFHDSRDPTDLERAVNLLHREESLTPNSVKPQQYLFLTALAANRLGEARKAIERIERIEPGGFLASQLKAYLLEREGSSEAALRAMEAAAGRLPSPRMLRALAEMQFRLGHTSEARGTVRRALAIVPEFRSRELLARIELLGGDPAEAAKLFSELDRRTTDFGISSNLGLSLFLLNRYDEAAEGFQKALRLAPRNPGANLNLADARLLAGRVEEARQLYRHVVSLIEEDPAGDGPELLTIKGQALAHLGQAKEAVASVSQALRQSPDNPQTLFEAALVYTLVEEPNSAIVSAEKAIRLGCDPRWFRFAWFEPLRSNPSFQELVKSRPERR